MIVLFLYFCSFFFSSRRRHTRCALVTGVQTCALPITLMKNPMSDPGFVETAHGLLAKDGVKVTVINDSPGFIAQRVIDMICNNGCMVATNRVSAPGDIHKRVEQGLNSQPSTPPLHSNVRNTTDTRLHTPNTEN